MLVRESLDFYNSLELRRAASTSGISIAPGPMFSAARRFVNVMRLNCGVPWTDAIEDDLATLGGLASDQAARASLAGFRNMHAPGSCVRTASMGCLLASK